MRHWHQALQEGRETLMAYYLANPSCRECRAFYMAREPPAATRGTTQYRKSHGGRNKMPLESQKMVPARVDLHGLD